jgi:hypothetical protein
MIFLKGTDKLSLAIPENCNLSLDLELLALNLMGFGALNLLFAVMMVFSRLDGATNQVPKKSSIRS